MLMLTCSKVISAQQLPRPRDENGREIMDKSIIDPFVQVFVHVPDWVNPAASLNGTLNTSTSNGSANTNGGGGGVLSRKNTDQEYVSSPTEMVSRNSSDSQIVPTQPARILSTKTGVVKSNGFNPVWEEKLSITFDVVGDMTDLVFVRFNVRDEGDDEESRPIAVYCSSVGSLRQGMSSLW